MDGRSMIKNIILTEHFEFVIRNRKVRARLELGNNEGTFRGS